MPSVAPETDTAEMVRSVPAVPKFWAYIPRPFVPVTVPLAVTDSAPVPLLVALMPLVPPETEAAEIVRSVPALLLSTKMPLPLVPVTAPFDVTDSAPEALLMA